jgi:thioredoxin reductase
MYDVVIVGGGPAGLSAALVLGRCGRRVLVCDSGTPRNAVSTALHGYLTRDGVPPLELLRLGRQELRAYDIELREVSVTDITRGAEGFSVTIGNSEQLHAHSVLLATGLRDELPAVPGIEQCYGITVHHCPYCDGWEHRRKALAVIGHGAGGAGLALSLKTWSDLVVLCTNGEPRLNRKQLEQLALHQIPLRQERLERIVHENGLVRAIVPTAGGAIQCDAIFFGGRPIQQSELPRRLGCEFTGKGTVKTDNLGETCVSGVYVVGDASRDVQFAVVAAAEGAKAGVAINKALQARAGLVVKSGT